MSAETPPETTGYAAGQGALDKWRPTSAAQREGEPAIARKPNYAFERQERERQKAIKVAEKAEAKRLQRERERGGAPSDDRQTDD